MILFIVLQKFMERSHDESAAGEILHEVRFELGYVGGGMKGG